MGNVSKQRVYVYPPKSLWFPALEFSSAVSGKLARELGWDPAAARREPLWWRDQAPRQMKGPLLWETHGILICFRWMCFLVIYIYIYVYLYLHLYLHLYFLMSFVSSSSFFSKNCFCWPGNQKASYGLRFIARTQAGHLTKLFVTWHMISIGWNHRFALPVSPKTGYIPPLMAS